MNVLFLLGESHAPDLLGALGNPFIRTPNLDRLARRGTVFRNAYCASPLCVPARASIATGRFPHETGYWDSSMAYDGRVDSWMKRLRKSGWHTAGIGKMHFRSDEDDNGFSEFIETMHIADGIGDLVSALRHEGHEPAYEGLWKVWTSNYGAGDDNPYRQYDERIVSEAEEWLTNKVPSLDRPWALAVHFIAAHAPFVTPKRFQALYDPADIPEPVRFSRQDRPYHPSIEHVRRIVCHEADMAIEHVQAIRAAYFATVSYLDDLAGRVLAALEASGAADDTLVIYTSDHGFSLGDHFIFGLFHMFEESLRVPLIMAGPGIPRAAVLDAPVSHTELYPTIMESCGITPKATEQKMLASSLQPLLQGKEEAGRAVFCEYHGTASLSGGYVMREGPYKLIHFVGMEPQLYDVETDPREAVNLADQPEHADRLKRLDNLLRDHVDPEQVDARAKADQKALVEAHGGAENVLRDMAGFSYSPPPGMSWKSMSE